MSIASDLSTLCTDQTTLVNDILSQAGIVGEISASDIAALSPLTTSPQTIQLVAGGNADLQTGFLTESFRVRVGGYAHFVNNPGESYTIQVVMNSLVIGQATPSGNGTTLPFFIDLVCFWQAGTNHLLVTGFSYQADSGPVTSSNQNSYQSLSSSSNMDFTITVQAGASDSGSVTIKEFRVLNF